MELYAFKRNNFILNKLLPCLFFTMFAIMCLYGSKVYADYDIIINNNSYSLPDSAICSNYNSVSSGESNVLWLYSYDENNNIRFSPRFSSGEFYIYENNNKKYYYCSSNFTQLRYDYSLQQFTYVNTLTADSPYNLMEVSGFAGIAYCSNNIYDVDGTLVFPIAPQSTLAPIVEQQEMKPLQEILGILPVVIVVLVGLIAIRKGILFLMARMKKA